MGLPKASTFYFRDTLSQGDKAENNKGSRYLLSLPHAHTQTCAPAHARTHTLARVCRQTQMHVHTCAHTARQKRERRGTIKDVRLNRPGNQIRWEVLGSQVGQTSSRRTVRGLNINAAQSRGRKNLFVLKEALRFRGKCWLFVQSQRTQNRQVISRQRWKPVRTQ